MYTIKNTTMTNNTTDPTSSPLSEPLKKSDVSSSHPTASRKINDEVQMLPEHRSRKPYGAKGKIAKINKVRMRIDFGNGYVFNVPKSMLMIAV